MVAVLIIPWVTSNRTNSLANQAGKLTKASCSPFSIQLLNPQVAMTIILPGKFIRTCQESLFSLSTLGESQRHCLLILVTLNTGYQIHDKQ